MVAIAREGWQKTEEWLRTDEWSGPGELQSAPGAQGLAHVVVKMTTVSRDRI